jgi:hypothetical protein
VELAWLEEPLPDCTEEDVEELDEPPIAELDVELEVLDPVAAVDPFTMIPTPSAPVVTIPNPASTDVTRRAPSRPASRTFMFCTLRLFLRSLPGYLDDSYEPAVNTRSVAHRVRQLPRGDHGKLVR